VQKVVEHEMNLLLVDNHGFHFSSFFFLLVSQKIIHLVVISIPTWKWPSTYEYPQDFSQVHLPVLDEFFECTVKVGSIWAFQRSSSSRPARCQTVPKDIEYKI
jgi:hypothetical protein